MKNFLLLIALMFSTVAFAEDALYLSEPMLCVGKIKGNYSKVHPSYYQIALKLTSLKVMRKDGTLAPGLNWKAVYAAPNEKLDLTFSTGYDNWWMGPLRISSAGAVYRNNVSGRNDNLNLKITNSSTPTGVRVDILVGELSLPGTVAGSYAYDLSCRALVVKDTTWVINNTKK